MLVILTAATKVNLLAAVSVAGAFLDQPRLQIMTDYALLHNLYLFVRACLCIYGSVCVC